jgi:two-component system, OmpR family, response regulator QseB
MRILILEDDTVLANGLQVGLHLAGMTAEVVGTCAEASAALAATTFDAAVLDLMLPDGSGLSVLKGLRASGDRTPVLLLTALDEVGDRIKGLDFGADDYLGKPFDLGELAARVRAIGRRGAGRAASCLAVGGLVLDPSSLSVTLDGQPIALSRREVMVLSFLMQRPGVIRSKSEIEDQLYGWQEGVESNTVEVHIHNLRAKVGSELIETVRGLGYRMRAAS